MGFFAAAAVLACCLVFADARIPAANAQVLSSSVSSRHQQLGAPHTRTRPCMPLNQVSYTQKEVGKLLQESAVYADTLPQDTSCNAALIIAWRTAFKTFKNAIGTFVVPGGGSDTTQASSTINAAYDTFKAVAKPAPPTDNEEKACLEAKVNAVLDHADARYNAHIAATSKMNAYNRGAYAGSNLHGAQPADYKKTPEKVRIAIKALATNKLRGWKPAFSVTAATSESLHKAVGAGSTAYDFIYHL